LRTFFGLCTGRSQQEDEKRKSCPHFAEL
jgi:hypothetical protein